MSEGPFAVATKSTRYWQAGDVIGPGRIIEPANLRDMDPAELAVVLRDMLNGAFRVGLHNGAAGSAPGGSREGRAAVRCRAHPPRGRELARTHTEEAIMTLAEIGRNERHSDAPNLDS
jgi:hypothetical protein